MIFSVLSLLAGIVLVQQFSDIPENYWIVILLISIFLLAFFRLWRLMFFTIGVLWAISFASMRLADRLPESIEGQHLYIEGLVAGLPQHDDRRVRFDFMVLKSSPKIPKKIRLSWYFPKQQIKAGQSWQMTVKLKKPHGRLNPGGFDYERWLFMENIAATGYIRNKPKPILIATPPVWKSFSTVRQAIADQLEKQLVGSENIGLIKALTIGDRNDISDKQWEVLRKTGTIHLVAISGLHIGLISGLVYFLVFKLSIKLSIVSPQKIAAISSVMIAIFYAALAGFSLPTQRALIMLTVAMVALTLQRNTTAKNILALAILGVVMFDPLAVLSAGFWLSFLAVMVIVYSLSGRLGKTNYWLGVTKIHCVTAMGLSPVLLFYFQQISIIAPIANFIAVPVVTLLLVPLCFIAVFALIVSVGVAQQILLLIDSILQGLWLVLSNLSEWPYAVITMATPPYYALPFALLGVLVLLAPRGIPMRWLGSVLLLPLFFTKQDKPEPGQVMMTLLDVGQGLSAVVQTTNHNLIFDTGAKYSKQFDMGKSVVVPFLQYKGIYNIDTLLISHGDNDHIGGAQSILEKSKVSKVLTSVPELLKQYQPTVCESGQKWNWDQVDFEIISPPLAVLNGENNNSCVLKVTAGSSSLLLTGDIEKQAEDWLAKQHGDMLKSNVLISPHHGSKTSSTLLFMKKVDPDVVLIPAGYKNRFSFPHTEVLTRYEKLNMKWMNVANEGAITVELKQNKFMLKTMRSDNNHYWNNKN